MRCLRERWEVRLGVKKAIGQRGSWFAEVDGQLLPCVHQYWLQGLSYHDPFAYDGSVVRNPDDPIQEKVLEFVEAIARDKFVILTEDKPELDTAGRVRAFQRTNYIAVYSIGDFSFDGKDGQRFRLTKRINPK